MMDAAAITSNALAGAALLLSVYAIWTTRKFNERQLSLIDQQLKQGENEAIDARKAQVGAALVRLDSKKYRVRVFNKGKAQARNVEIEFDSSDLVPRGQLSGKFPMEILDPHGSVDLIAFVHMDTAQKHSAVLKWADDFSETNQRTVYLTL